MRVIILAQGSLYRIIIKNINLINPLIVCDHVINFDDLLHDISLIKYDCAIIEDTRGILSKIIHLRTKKKNIPIILISNTAINCKVPAIESGADYYIENFNREKIMELTYSITTMARRAKGIPFNLVTMGDITIDLDSGDLYQGGELVPMRAKEMKFIEYMVLRNGRIIPYEDIEEAFNVSRNNIWVHITAIKTKLRLKSDHPARLVPKCGRGLFLNKINHSV